MKITSFPIIRAALTAVLFGVMVEANDAEGFEPTGVVIHQETLYRSDGKGDNWCITWAADDSQVTSMDDGDWLNTGTYFHNHLYRILGGPDGFTRQDLPEYADLSGEAGSWFGYGIISVDGILYSAISKTPGPRWSGPFRGIKLLKSGDNGSTWYRVDRQGRERKIGRLDDARNDVNSEEMFFLEEFGVPHQTQAAYPFSYVNFVQHGRDNSAAKDHYVYIYSPEGAHSHKLLLARVEKQHLAVRNEWRYFVKFDKQGDPVWSTEIQHRGCVHVFPEQHPIGMTGAPIANADLFASPADWTAPTSKDGYNADPPAADGSKVIIADVDHVWPKQYRQWVWKSLTRGLNTAFMDLYGATRIGDKQIKDLRFVGDWVSQHETTRTNMGYSRRYAEQMNLAAMTPRGDLSTTGYCLAAPGKEYLVYQPGEGPFQLQLEGGDKTLFAVEWFDPKTGKTTAAKQLKATGAATFEPPFAGDAVLCLKAQSR